MEQNLSKRCSSCKQDKLLNEFPVRHKRGRIDQSSRCKACGLIKLRAWEAANPERVVQAKRRKAERNRRDPVFLEKEKVRKHNVFKEYRRTILAAYGSACACCGIDWPQFLTIEHKNGDGAEHRRRCHGVLGTYQDIIRRGFPDDIELLCWNCNCAKGFYGKCPHQMRRELGWIDEGGILHPPGSPNVHLAPMCFDSKRAIAIMNRGH